MLGVENSTEHVQDVSNIALVFAFLLGVGCICTPNFIYSLIKMQGKNVS